MRRHATWIARTLDVVLLVLGAAAGLGLLVAVPAMVGAWIRPEGVAGWLQPAGSGGRGIDLHHAGVPAFLFTELVGGLALLSVILWHVRRLMRSVPLGTPFAERNVRSLWWIAGAIAAGVAFDAVVPLLLSPSFRRAAGADGPSVDMVGIVAVLVLLVQAEIVGEGARLRRDAELTI